MAEMSLPEILTATRGRVVGGEPPSACGGVSIDSRTLHPGELYVALTGERFDGHEFAAQAFARGASAVLVSRELALPGVQIVVEDTLLALGEIAAAHRAALRPVVIGVTGSVGKTTTKDMIAAILSQGWRTVKTHANFNNEVGLPLTLLDLDVTHQALVVEMAMRGKGQIAYLSRLAQPQIGVVTNVGISHLELLGSRDAIAEAKAELLEVLPVEGRAVLNRDDEYFEFLAARSEAPVLSFGTSKEAAVRIVDLTLDEEMRAQFRLVGETVDVEVTCGAPGRHHALNAAAAASAALAAGAPAAWIAQGLAGFGSGEMRGRVAVAPGGFTVIDDSYNAAPDSMRAALALLMDVPGTRKWAALGDMRELGDASVEQHHEMGVCVGKLGLAGLVTVGDLGRHIAEGAREAGMEAWEAPDNAAAAAELKAHVAAGDAVLVKGSRAMQMEEIVGALLREEDACPAG